MKREKLPGFEAAKRHAEQLLGGLPEGLHYHNRSHTLRVYGAADTLAEAERVSAYNRLMLGTAAMYHDLGHAEGRAGHEAASARMAAEALPEFGYRPDDISRIRGLILSTQFPQRPRTLLQRIICDADLCYLGADDFMEVSENLRLETGFEDKTNWYRNTLDFLESHEYFTGSARCLWTGKSAENAAKLRSILGAAERLA